MSQLEATTEDIEQMFETLQNEIHELETKITKLEEFYRYIGSQIQKNDEAFDEDDLSQTKECIEKHYQRLDDLKKQYEKKIDKYQQYVVGLDKVINARKNALDYADEKWGVLNENPQLLDYFAEKHCNLIQFKEEAFKELQLFDANEKIPQTKQKRTSRSSRSHK